MARARSIGDRFAQNAALLYPRHPQLRQAIEGIGTPVSRLIADAEGGAANIDLGPCALYPEDAAVWAETQVVAHLADPDRIRVPDPARMDRISGACADLLPEVDAWITANVKPGLAQFPVTGAEYGFVFGVGLGRHILPLIERAPCRNLVLIEPMAEFLRHSLAAIDWGAIVEAAARQGTTICFVLGPDPERMVREIEGLLVAGARKGLIDGAYAFMHYPSWEIRRTRELLNERIGNFLVHQSYFEDEFLMMRNCHGNLRRWPFRVIDAAPRPARDTPLLIVGSGPSLDRDLAALKTLSDRAVVLSCGSALGVLLKNGITPDAHVENENSAPLVRNLAALSGRYDLSNIVLIASTTIDPEAAAPFAERWLYYRDLLSPAHILNPGIQPLRLTGPMVANAAAAAATTLGFRHIHLFGVDCGRREGAAHHARDSVYLEPGYDNFVAGENADTLETEFTREVPGNFGGRIMASAYMDLSRRTLSELQRQVGVPFINCSDGAKIDGATPKVSAALRLPPLARGKAAVLADLAASLPAIAPGQIPTALDLGRRAEAGARFSDAYLAAVAEAAATARDFAQLETMIEAALAQRAEAAPMLRLMGGSFASLLRLGRYRHARIEDPAVRDAFFRFFVAIFERGCRATIERGRRLLDQIADGRDTLTVPDWVERAAGTPP